MNSQPMPDIAIRGVDRAVGDTRRGGLVVVTTGGTAIVAQAAELADATSLARLAGLSSAAPRVVLAPWRAAALGLAAERDRPIGIELGATPDPVLLRALIDPTSTDRGALADLPARAIPEAGAGAAAAIELAKLAELLPAAVVGGLHSRPAAELRALVQEEDLLLVEAAAVLDYRRRAALTLRPVVEARMPLADAEQARLIAFRPANGGVEQLAVIVGEPDMARPVLCRLHSECFTGDLLGSMRCDCGEQLRGAILRMAEQGGGVLLYLAHEGRGIGLINKLRAYGLQDRGLDTLDANQHLGFAPDERTWIVAATMLRALGIDRVRLLTNNPDKIRALADQGIEVVARVAHAFHANHHNHGYLRTKALRGGHDLRVDATDPPPLPHRASRTG